MYAATEHQICSFTALLVVGAEKLLNAQTGSSHPSSNRGHPLSRPKLKSMLALRSVDKEIDRTLVTCGMVLVTPEAALVHDWQKDELARRRQISYEAQP